MRRAHTIGLTAGALLALATTAALGQQLELTHRTSIFVDARGFPLNKPEGIACGKDGVVIVADTGAGRLLRYEYRDGAAKGGTEIRFKELRYPTRVRLDAKGGALVLDARSQKLVRVGPDGKLAGFVDLTGTPVESPYYVDVKLDADGSVYLLDARSTQVLVFDGAGAFRRKVGFPKEAGIVTDFVLGRGGVLYAISATSAKLYSEVKGAGQFTPLGASLSQYLSFPGSLEIDRGGGNLLVVDEHGNGIVVLGTDGAYHGRQLSFGWRDGLLNDPGDICVDDGGDLLVADRLNNRVQVFAVSK